MLTQWKMAAVGAISAVMILVGCGAVSVSTTPPAPTTTTTGAQRGPASLYPNPALTPGDVLPGVTAKEVCVPGYSSSVRSVSSNEKEAVYQRYGVVNEPGKHEVDHFISLELGGSNMVTNLWPEPYVTPDAPGKIGAHEKDAVEDRLHREVCAGRMTLDEAQRIIRIDWYLYYVQTNGKA